MLSRLFGNLREQWMGALALFLVLTGGSAYALAGHNTVFSDDIAPKQVRQTDLKPAMSWHEVDPADLGHGATGGSANDCAWLNYIGQTYETVAFYRDPYGIVRLKGFPVANFLSCTAVKPAIFTLPLGYRPARSKLFGVRVQDGFGAFSSGGVFAGPDGTVTPDIAPPDGIPTNAYSLEGISFRCAPSGHNGCP
jgi:hypothetical protein